jgi:hypothetical protein
VPSVTPPGPTATPSKQPHPGDTDGDGCSDAQENGPDARAGGRRDYLSYWDFFDVPVEIGPGVWYRDREITVFGDLFGVAGRYSATGTPGDPIAPVPPAPAYHSAFDRGPPVGPNFWNLGPPDGAINVFDDILGVSSQFGHRCS